MAWIKLTKSIVVEASHKLEAHTGKCHRLHGHSWKIEVTILSPVNPTTHMGVDYYHLSKFLHDVVDGTLDHQHLNTVLATENPTSEYLAHWVFAQAVKWVRQHNYTERNGLNDAVVHEVVVWETKNSRCSLTGEQWLADPLVA